MTAETVEATQVDSGSVAPWEKVLWRKQPYEDNYVPDSFLAELKNLPARSRPTIASLVVHALPISQHLAVITLFLSIFHALLVGRFAASQVGWTVVLVVFAGFLVRRWGWEDVRRVDRATKQSSELLPPSTSIRPLILPPLLLSLLSPVLGTLTSATTSDSIWPLAGFLFFLHLLLVDFTTGPDARQKRRERLQRERKKRRDSFQGDLEVVEEKSLTSSLSLTSALCASVVLASRLPSTAHVFSLILLAVSLFAGWPPIAKSVREAGKGFSILLTASMILLSVSLIPGGTTYRPEGTSSNLTGTPVLIFLLVILLVNVVGPLMFWWGWRWKTIRGGGWDVAVVKVRQSEANMLR